MRSRQAATPKKPIPSSGSHTDLHMQRKLWEITSHMLLKASWACWQEREHLLRARGDAACALPAPCPRKGSGASVISGNRAVTQHIWRCLPQQRWEPGGVASPRPEHGCSSPHRGRAVAAAEGCCGKQQRLPSAAAPRSWKFASRGEP